MTAAEVDSFRTFARSVQQLDLWEFDDFDDDGEIADSNAEDFPRMIGKIYLNGKPASEACPTADDFIACLRDASIRGRNLALATVLVSLNAGLFFLRRALGRNLEEILAYNISIAGPPLGGVAVELVSEHVRCTVHLRDSDTVTTRVEAKLGPSSARACGVHEGLA